MPFAEYQKISIISVLLSNVSMGFLENGAPLWGKHRLLLTESSYNCGKNKDGSIKGPTMISSLATVMFYLLLITGIEIGLFQVFTAYKVSASRL